MKIKKLTALFLVVIMLLPAVPIMASAASVNDLEYEIVDGEVIITGCNKNVSGELVIPDTIEGYPVTGFGYETFLDCNNLESIKIPKSVIKMPKSAFSNCSKLKDIFFDGSAFDFWKSGEWHDCATLDEIYYYSYNYNILKYNSTACDLHFADSVNIGIAGDNIVWIFDTNDTSKTMKFIGSGDIYNTSSDESLHEMYGCYGRPWTMFCSDVLNIEMDDRITGYIEAFEAFYKLKTVKLPENIKNIDKISFADCYALTEFNIPKSVVNLYGAAFAECENLNKITVPISVKYIGQSVFRGCNSLTDVYYDGTEEDWNKIEIEDYNNECLLNATIHFKEKPHTHTYTHISIPATCTVDGMEYDICSDCGDVINSKVLTATGHNWGKWKTILEPTGTADGKAERKCSKCGDVESKIIAKLNVVKDDDTGIEIQFRDEFDSNIEIKVEEKFDGKSFQLLDMEYPDTKTKVFDITTYEDGVKVQPDGKVTVRIPLPEGFGTKNIFVCYVDTENSKVTKISAKVVDGFVEFSAEHFSEYAVVELSGKAEKVSISDVTVNYKDSAKIVPQISIDGEVKYTVEYAYSDPSVAVVDKDGNITTIHKGVTNITCTVTDEYGNTFKDTCTVTVKFQWWQWIIWILLLGFLWY